MEDQDATSRETQISTDASITNPERAPVRLLGSHSSLEPLLPVTLGRPPGDGQPLLPNGGGEPQPAPLPVSVPDLALQFSPCLSDVLLQETQAAVQEAVGPNADIRALCRDGTERIGIWLQPAFNQAIEQLRISGMEALNVILPSESLAFFVNAAYIRTLAQTSWDAQPKRLNGKGQADPNGPIHLTTFSVSFQSPKQIITQVGGFDERPWPDVDFTLTTTDTLTESAGLVNCDSKTTLDTDTSWLNFLTGAFLLVFPPFGDYFLYERILVGNADAPSTGSGVGCAAAQLIPHQILIPDGLKIVTNYGRIEVSAGGIFAGGSYRPTARTPKVLIGHSLQISVEEGTPSVSSYFTVGTEDLRGQLQIAWTADGRVLSPTAQGTLIRFDLSGSHVGDTLAKHVEVRVTDEDDLMAQAEAIVLLHVVGPFGLT